MSCYYQGCQEPGTTKEHIPPKAFFPKDQRDQLLTVRSCHTHNTKKSRDDVYVLAQICMNTSPANRSREIFLERIVPQLAYNADALRKTLVADAVPLAGGGVRYKVDESRFDRFFTALSCGIVYKSRGATLPDHYAIGHVYHSFQSESEPESARLYKEELLTMYSGEPSSIMEFGAIATENESIYKAKIFGIKGFKSSITIVHVFFGTFRVDSMLSLRISRG